MINLQPEKNISVVNFRHDNRPAGTTILRAPLKVAGLIKQHPERHQEKYFQLR